MAITMGLHCMLMLPGLQTVGPVKNPARSLLLHVERLMDGWGWKPTSNGSSYKALDRRICKEILPESTWFESKGELK
jgi:hypothetical protein